MILLMGKGKVSRQKILIEAFRLFATMPYDRVSFSVMEQEIGISRGSMIYYFKNKEGLFREVIHTFVYRASSVKAVPDAYRLSLCSFYNYFIEILKLKKEHICDIGIVNINEALMRIENSALFCIPDFKEECKFGNPLLKMRFPLEKSKANQIPSALVTYMKTVI
jgi:hypothetical protein